MTEEHGSRMLRLFYRALEHEEGWLANAIQSAQKENRPYELAIKSVRQFDEKWIQYLVVRQSVCDRDSPRVDTETEGHCDFVFHENGNGGNLAAFELKGPFHVKDQEPGAKQIEEIKEDCRKLAKNKRLAKVPKYVVLLPYGDESEVSRWLESLREELPHVGPSGHPAPGNLNLNDLRDRGTTMMITLFLVN